ncbi:Rpn family recombination-promoting nuclease/putative transposase, partial [Tyzzerella sp. OttesenSCG-928-J15]|nr:Rpn family recombination-promoting nuclease/putative transposase [Tyzzerella sp. OttesenSCG-928-J15]
MEKELLSPKSDLIFKLIFGDNKNTDILADFLQAVLDLPESEYSHLEIVDPHLQPETPERKLGILDVKLHTNSGKVVNIEIQVADVSPMRERIVFYTSKMITEQIGKGDNYNAIKKVISIVITDYRLIPENEEYHNRYHLYDKNTGSKFTDILEINVLELPKVPKETDNSQLWNWLRFLKSEREEELSMLAEKNKKIEKAVGVL